MYLNIAQTQQVNHFYFQKRFILQPTTKIIYICGDLFQVDNNFYAQI